ncbi:MAG TPA: hypothetical protein VK395_12605, partial [Gemmataceae bacterium]|nr:hypothetical protein [Gemmataceae bacterium]
ATSHHRPGRTKGRSTDADGDEDVAEELLLNKICTNRLDNGSFIDAMLCDTPLTGNDLIVEAGPGIRAVVAHLRKHRLPVRIQPVELRASAEDGFVEGLWRVTKASVIETTRLVLQEDRLVFDDLMPPEVMASTPSAQTIYHGLLTYVYNKTPPANDAFASREGADDDLILAVALACWFGECCRKTFWIR